MALTPVTGYGTTGMELAAAHQEIARLRSRVAELERAQANGQGSNGLGSEIFHHQAVQVMAMAQQTADAHLAETSAEVARLLSEAQEQADDIVRDAARNKKEMEVRVEQLRIIERDYRVLLRNFLVARLDELDRTATLEPRI